MDLNYSIFYNFMDGRDEALITERDCFNFRHKYSIFKYTHAVVGFLIFKKGLKNRKVHTNYFFLIRRLVRRRSTTNLLMMKVELP